MDVEVIERLGFRQAFKCESRIESIRCADDYLKELFELSERTHLFVYDDEDKGFSVYVTDTSGLGRDKTFEVENKSRKEVFLLHIDGILFKKNSKCDCALLTDKELFFIEFKTKSTSGCELTRKEQCQKCFSQLQLTVTEFFNRFREAGTELTEKFEEIRAFAVFNPSVPRVNASESNLSIRFRKKTGIGLAFINKAKLR